MVPPELTRESEPGQVFRPRSVLIGYDAVLHEEKSLNGSEMGTRIILASRSPRRVELLRQIGIAPEVMPADIDETVQAGESPERYVLRMAREKALAIAAREEAIVLGADTSVVLGERIFGKPASETEAIGMLRALSGRTHRVLSGVAVAVAGRVESRLSCSEVTFRKLDDEEIHRYWRSGEPTDKAGGYAVQGLGAVFIESIRGSYSGIMGLPLFETAALLAAVGVEPLGGNDGRR